MLRKLLMGSKKQYKLFIIPKITQVNVNEYEILSDIYPKNDHYLKISSIKTRVSGSGISFADHVVTGSAMEKVVFTRLDSGKTLEISTVANENTRNTNHVWKCSVNLCENLYTKDRYPNNIKTRIRTGRHSCLVKSDRFIFKGRCRQGNSFINPNRIASSALCAGGSHA